MTPHLAGALFIVLPSRTVREGRGRARSADIASACPSDISAVTSIGQHIDRARRIPKREPPYCSLRLKVFVNKGRQWSSHYKLLRKALQFRSRTLKSLISAQWLSVTSKVVLTQQRRAGHSDADGDDN